MNRREALMNMGAAGIAAGLIGCSGGDDVEPQAVDGAATAPGESDRDMGFSLEMIETNGIALRAAVAGEGPLVVLVHGWPELWYSWRHQIRALASAGYKVVAPDVRGYGGSDKPQAVGEYTMTKITADVVGLIDAMGEEQASLVGHDWGAPIVWNTSVLHPGRVRAVAGLSVPYFQRGEVPPTVMYKALYPDTFFYQLYFQQEGVPEAELEADVRRSLLSVYYAGSGDASPEAAAAFGNKPVESGLLDGMLLPEALPEWLTEADLEYFVAAYEASGFRGPLNRYRAQDRDWEELPQLSELTVDQPSCFIAGSRDGVRYMVPGVDLFANPGAFCTDFRGATIVDGEGHWIQQEAPEAVNRALIEFLQTV